MLVGELGVESLELADASRFEIGIFRVHIDQFETQFGFATVFTVLVGRLVMMAGCSLLLPDDFLLLRERQTIIDVNLSMFLLHDKRLCR